MKSNQINRASYPLIADVAVAMVGSVEVGLAVVVAAVFEACLKYLVFGVPISIAIGGSINNSPWASPGLPAHRSPSPCGSHGLYPPPLI